MSPVRGFFRRSLRGRITWGVGLLMAALGLLLFVYLASLPYLLIPTAEQQVLVAPGPTSANGPPAPTTPSLSPPLHLVAVAHHAQQRFWWYGLLGTLALVALATAWTYVLTGRFLRSLFRLQHTVNQLDVRNLPPRLPEFGPEEEVRDLTAAYNRFLARVREVLDAHQRFVADAAHELRSPLATLRIQTAVLHQGTDLTPAERAQLWQEVDATLSHMTRTLEGLLLLLRQPPPPDSWPTLAFDQLVRQVVRSMQPLAQALRITLQLDRAEAVWLRGEPRALQAVVRNLVDNALRYNDPGGAVHVRVYPQGPWAVLEVADTGWGIPPEEQALVFQRFFRGQRAQAEDGSGLGLALVQTWVQHHQGQVDVRSTVGQGSVFIVRLPRLNPPPA